MRTNHKKRAFAVTRKQYGIKILNVGIIMEISEIKRYCISKAKAEETFPFGAVPICYRLEGKIFAQLYSNALDFKITLKCTFEPGEMYRSLFPEQVK